MGQTGQMSLLQISQYANGKTKSKKSCMSWYRQFGSHAARKSFSCISLFNQLKPKVVISHIIKTYFTFWRNDFCLLHRLIIKCIGWVLLILEVFSWHFSQRCSQLKGTIATELASGNFPKDTNESSLPSSWAPFRELKVNAVWTHVTVSRRWWAHGYFGSLMSRWGWG